MLILDHDRAAIRRPVALPLPWGESWGEGRPIEGALPSPNTPARTPSPGASRHPLPTGEGRSASFLPDLTTHDRRAAFQLFWAIGRAAPATPYFSGGRRAC
jgi:hypothetical protein